MADGSVNNSKLNIVVTGDVCVDWTIAENCPQQFNLHNLRKSKEEWVTANPEGGSSWLLGNLIDVLCGKKANVTKRAYREGYSRKAEIDQLYTIYQRYPSPSKKDQNEKVWRTQKHLGWQRRKNDESFKKDLKSLNLPGTTNIDLLIVDDKSFGFRKKNICEIHKDLDLKKVTNIMWRMARPLFDSHGENKEENKLNECLTHNKTILIITANDLRSANVRISRELSWEDTALDVRNAILKKIDYCNKLRWGSSIWSMILSI